MKLTKVIQLTDSNWVLNPSWDDEVCPMSLRLNIFVKVRLHELKPLLYTSFDVSSSVFYVSKDFSCTIISFNLVHVIYTYVVSINTSLNQLQQISRIY
jgi:hypothetical protein